MAELIVLVPHHPTMTVPRKRARSEEEEGQEPEEQQLVTLTEEERQEAARFEEIARRAAPKNCSISIMGWAFHFSKIYLYGFYDVLMTAFYRESL